MKKDIHPAYQEVTVTCGCGNSFVTRSTAAKIAVEVCANCHPFFTGKQKFIDAAGMVEKFTKKWSSDAAIKMKAAQQPKAPVKKAAAVPPGRVQQTLSAQLGGGEKKPPPSSAPKVGASEGKPAPAPKAGAPEGKPAPKAPAAAPPAPKPAAPKPAESPKQA